MSYLGEIKIFAGTYAPRGWALCDGQLLDVNKYKALSELLGNTYGGDGKDKFGLPDMRGRVAIKFGHGKMLQKEYYIGQRCGSESVPTTPFILPIHTHEFMGSKTPSTDTLPNGKVFAEGLANDRFYSSDTSQLVELMPESIEYTGSSSPAPHPNLMPYLCVTYIICLEGIFPSRT